MMKTEAPGVAGSSATPQAPHSRFPFSRWLGLNVTVASVRCAQRSSRRETHASAEADDTFPVPSTLAVSSRIAWKSHVVKVRVRPILSREPLLGRCALRFCGEPAQEARRYRSILKPFSDPGQNCHRSLRGYKRTRASVPLFTSNEHQWWPTVVKTTVWSVRRLHDAGWVRGRPFLHCNFGPETATQGKLMGSSFQHGQTAACAPSLCPSSFSPVIEKHMCQNCYETIKAYPRTVAVKTGGDSHARLLWQS